MTPLRVFVLLTILGFGLRVGYGVARYHRVISRSGEAFVRLWDHDALEHVLIAKAILSGKGYVVDEPPRGVTTPVRLVGQDALFKAPAYEFFLAGIFAVSGFSFKLMLPLQALLGGVLSGLIGLIALEIFDSENAAMVAGIAACAHPILVNAASQPYNENLFFCFFALSIWAFLRWLRRPAWKPALCGAIATGLGVLTRENAVLPLVALGVVLLITRSTMRIKVGYAVMVVTAAVVVLPWTIRNYVRFGIFIPVASIVGQDLSEWNNQCIGQESAFTPYWAEGPCASLNEQRRAIPKDSSLPEAVRRNRISQHIAVQFITNHPGVYAKLAFRRLWTTLLPYDPRGGQHALERIALLLYWLLIYPMGIVGLWLAHEHVKRGTLLLITEIVLNLLSIVLVLYWSDLRFRIGFDLSLGCFAGLAYANWLAHLGSRAPQKASSMITLASQ
jgi:4-amino-4-deoxy-L-arabinose transferase-like glycosyltransferase